MWPPLVQLWKHLERRQAGALARTRAGLPARRTTPLDPRLGRVRAAGELRRRFVPGGVVTASSVHEETHIWRSHHLQAIPTASFSVR